MKRKSQPEGRSVGKGGRFTIVPLARRSAAGSDTLQGEVAFTLIELMVVIALIGILTAMILPEMKGTMEDARLRATSRELINAFHLAYSRAVSVGQVHRVRLDGKANRYLIETSLPGAGGEPEFVPVKDVPGSEGELDSRILIAVHRSAEEGEQIIDTTPAAATGLQQQAIAFYPDGTADRTDIKLEDRSGFRLILRVNPTTSRVLILDPTVEPPSAAPPASTEVAP